VGGPRWPPSRPPWRCVPEPLPAGLRQRGPGLMFSGVARLCPPVRRGTAMQASAPFRASGRVVRCLTSAAFSGASRNEIAACSSAREAARRSPARRHAFSRPTRPDLARACSESATMPDTYAASSRRAAAYDAHHAHGPGYVARPPSAASHEAVGALCPIFPGRPASVAAATSVLTRPEPAGPTLRILARAGPRGPRHDPPRKRPGPTAARCLPGRRCPPPPGRPGR